MINKQKSCVTLAPQRNKQFNVTTKVRRSIHLVTIITSVRTGTVSFKCSVSNIRSQSNVQCQSNVVSVKCTYPLGLSQEFIFVFFWNPVTIKYIFFLQNGIKELIQGSEMTTIYKLLSFCFFWISIIFPYCTMSSIENHNSLRYILIRVFGVLQKFTQSTM